MLFRPYSLCFQTVQNDFLSPALLLIQQTRLESLEWPRLSSSLRGLQIGQPNPVLSLIHGGPHTPYNLIHALAGSTRKHGDSCVRILRDIPSCHSRRKSDSESRQREVSSIKPNRLAKTTLLYIMLILHPISCNRHGKGRVQV